VTRLAEVAIRAGTVTSFRRIVGVVALARAGPVMVAAARVKGKADPLALWQARAARARFS